MTTDFKAIVARADCEAFSEFHWAQATEDRKALIAMVLTAKNLIRNYKCEVSNCDCKTCIEAQVWLEKVRE